MSINDYVKFMTQTLTSYIDQPKEERKQTKQKQKSSPPAVSHQWFGLLPFAVKLFKKPK